MAVQLQQAASVAKYLIGQRLRGNKRFPLVLMLEPLFRCNLACPGCGKIQHPKEILKQHLETCVVDAIENQDAERVVEELVQVFRRAPSLDLSDLQSEAGVKLLGLDVSKKDTNCCH